MWTGLFVGVLTAPAGAADVTIAIWRLKPLALDAATADRLEVLLRAETSRLRGFRLQPKKRTAAVLGRPEHATLRSCGGETDCLCAIGKALRVNKLVTGVIGALGDDYTFDLKLVDMASCREERRINEALSGQEDLLIGAIRRALYKLVVPSQFVGSLAVAVPVEGAEILVDGQPAGQTPLRQSIGGLRPGSHQLQIRKEGFSDFEDTVPVRFQQTTRVKVDLVTSSLMGLSYEKEQEEAKAPPSLPVAGVRKERSGTTRILAWSSLGLTGAAVLVGALCGWRSRVAEQELESAVQNGELNADHQATVDRGETLALWSNVGWGLAGGAAVLTVVLFLVDGFADDGDDATRVSPAAGRNGAGLTVQWKF
jgi:hypothetical protein